MCKISLFSIVFQVGLCSAAVPLALALTATHQRNALLHDSEALGLSGDGGDALREAFGTAVPTGGTPCGRARGRGHGRALLPGCVLASSVEASRGGARGEPGLSAIF